MKPRSLTPDEQFFYDHAGFSHKVDEPAERGKRRCAISLARAEHKAKARGIVFEWNDDDERAYCYCDDPTCEYHEGSSKDWETLYCVAYEDCYCKNAAHTPHRNILASLCSIMEPDRNYKRVIEAELASEALCQ